MHKSSDSRGRLKHLDIKLKFVRKAIKLNHMKIQYISSVLSDLMKLCEMKLGCCDCGVKCGCWKYGNEHNEMQISVRQP